VIVELLFDPVEARHDIVHAFVNARERRSVSGVMSCSPCASDAWERSSSRTCLVTSATHPASSASQHAVSSDPSDG
jgi:hypothetical protein